MKQIMIALLLFAGAAQAEPVDIPPEIAIDNREAATAVFKDAVKTILMNHSYSEVPVADAEGTRRAEIWEWVRVLRNPSSTEDDPSVDLYLEFWGAVEGYGETWSITPIATVRKFHGARRALGGIYELEGTVKGDYWHKGCKFHRVRYRVNALDLLNNVRRPPDLRESEVRRYRNPVEILATPRHCSDSG